MVKNSIYVTRGAISNSRDPGHQVPQKLGTKMRHIDKQI